MSDKSHKAVPREPTVEMLRVSVENGAATRLREGRTVLCSGCLLGAVWEAMYDAAPVLATAPAEPPKDGEVALIVDRLRGWANYDSPPADHKWSLLQEDLREAIARLVWRN